VKIVLTGAEGFFGRHTRRPLEAVGGHGVVPEGRRDFNELESVADGRRIDRFVVHSGYAEKILEPGSPDAISHPVGNRKVAAER